MILPPYWDVKKQTDPPVGHLYQVGLHIWPVWCSEMTPFNQGEKWHVTKFTASKHWITKQCTIFAYLHTDLGWAVINTSYKKTKDKSKSLKAFFFSTSLSQMLGTDKWGKDSNTQVRNNSLQRFTIGVLIHLISRPGNLYGLYLYLRNWER